LLIRAEYQRSEKPPQTVAMDESLNDNRINISMGKYKKAKPKQRAENIKRDDLFMVIFSPAGCAETT
jgi:hypothetical protein